MPTVDRVATLAPRHAPFGGQLVFLGTGTSHGIPVIGCPCGVCVSKDPRNHRTRCAVAFGLPEGVLLIDTPPELRLQLNREHIGVVHAVAMTHAHADHLFGLDDLRIMSCYTQAPIPFYCEPEVQATVRQAFSYAFMDHVQHYPAGGVPKLLIDDVRPGEPFMALGAQILPIRLDHGMFRCVGYRVGEVAYCTDVKSIPPESLDLLAGLDTLIIDCLRPTPHVTHMNLEEALATVTQLAPRQTYFTHISHHFEHTNLETTLPSHIRPAYDGLRIPIAGPMLP